MGIKYGLTATEQTDLKDEIKMFTRDPVGDKRIVEVQDFDELLKEANNVAGKPDVPTQCKICFLRWLKTVLQKMENSRLRLVFLDCYFLMSNKEYRTDVKYRPKGSNLFTEATQLSLLWQR